MRYLYQGILQIGVGFEHLRRANAYGARRLWRRGIVYLDPFRGGCMGVDVDRLIGDTERCLAGARADRRRAPALRPLAGPAGPVARRERLDQRVPRRQPGLAPGGGAAVALAGFLPHGLGPDGHRRP